MLQVPEGHKPIAIDIDDGNEASDVSEKFSTASLPISRAARYNANGGRRTRSENSDQGTMTSPVASQKFTPSVSLTGEEQLQRLINEAEYEIHQDPYRGILSHRQSLEIQTKITTPWHVCEWGALRPEPLEGIDDLDDPQIVVRHVGNCACPSLKIWTEAVVMERNKKTSSRKRRRADTVCMVDAVKPRFQAGVRHQDESFACPCDFNPLCLATLGGVVNEVIEERCRELDPFVPVDGEGVKCQPVERPDPPLISKYFRNASLTRAKPNESGDGDSVEAIEETSMKNIVDTNSHVVYHDGISSIVEVGELPKAECEPSIEDDDESSDPFIMANPASSSSTTKSPSLPPVRRLTPLLEPLQKIDPGDPMKVFLEGHVSPQDVSCIEFSSHTNEARKRCRSSVQVDTAGIRSYVRQNLTMSPAGGEGDEAYHVTVEEYMKTLKEWHDHLLFVNPVASDAVCSSDKITLSLPPGIRNLGATCYLNSQLQCLAQNLTFLNGIFSWHVVDETHRMNSVMTKLQLLLAQMFLGGESKLTTLEFSNALGLEHYEQQDPNEFARLLFDRMDESFQQCDNDGDLSNLLKQIFHGVATYETICLTCGKKSERNEGFMDLNLPIVKPPKEPKKISRTIDEAFASMSAKDIDTNVQYCLDQYTREEMLDGENQYFCSECDQKRDARRILKLTELPPVLNVQLSRYVFDRTKFTKKKVCDKVLLPTSLEVATGGVTNKFMLCAVMRHQGNSAYSGHYLAEAMDWMSGKWFEFNDEIVKLLPDGPSSSFDPHANDTRPLSVSAGDKGKGPTLSGSQDAYNMYYVEEGYLSKAVQAAVIWRRELCGTGPNAGEVLGHVTTQRKEQFIELSRLHVEDSKLFDRLYRRRLGIRKYFLPCARSLVPDESSSDRFVWVSTGFLRQYLKCKPDDELDSLFESRGPIIQNNDFRCPHGDGLEPQVAHTGKLLSLKMYDTLVGLLRGERALVRGESQAGDAPDEAEIEDCMIASDMNLICNECSKAHRANLLRKLDRVRVAKALFVALDPTVGDAELAYDGIGVPESVEKFVFVIPRQSALKFRKNFTQLMRSLAKTACCETATKSWTKPLSMCQGLGALNLSSIECENEFKNFNESITCCHGNLLDTSGRQLQYISSELWRMIHKLFPASVEHKVERELKCSAGSTNYSCNLCIAERDSAEQLRDTINRWAVETKDARAQVAKDGSDDVDVYHLIHIFDISTWRGAVKVLSNLKRIKGESVEAVQDFVENLIFPSRHTIVPELQPAPIDKFGGSLRSFICREHRKVVKDGILVSRPSCSGETTSTFASYVIMVNKAEYHLYLKSIASLLCILEHTKLSASGGLTDSAVGGETNGFMEDVRVVSMSHHPSINLRQSCDIDTKNYLQLSIDGCPKELIVSPSMCSCETCSAEFTPLLVADKQMDDFRTESTSVGRNDSMPISTTKTNKSGGFGVADSILVESDIEEDLNSDKYPLRVFQVKEASSEEETLKSLRSISVVASDTAAVSDVRRSNRKRKQIYPIGVLLSEETIDVCVHYNIAAVCLLMFQSGIQIDFSKLIVVVHQPFEKPRMVHTTTSEGDLKLTIRQVIGDDEKNVDIAQNITLLYERHKDRPNGSGTCVSDDFFQNSNIHDDASAAAKGIESQTIATKKIRPSERGFQGTLLQGFQPTASSASGLYCKDIEDDENVIESHPEMLDDRGNNRAENLKKPGLAVAVDDSSAMSTRALSPSSLEQEVSSGHDNSEDERILSQGPTFGYRPQKKVEANRTVGHIIDITESNVDENTLQKLMDALVEAVGGKDRERCGLAATIALSSQPPTAKGTDFDELLASALGVYFTSN